MHTDEASKKTHKFLYERDIDEIVAKSVNPENIVSLSQIHSRPLDVDVVKKVLNHIQSYGMNIVSVSAEELLEDLDIDKEEIQSYYRCSEQYQLEAQIDSYFGKKQIGSLNNLFCEHLPRTFQEWTDIIETYCAQRIKEESKRATKKISKFIEYMTGDLITNKQEKHCAGRIEETAFLLAKEKSFNGFALQFSILMYLSQMLSLPHSFGNDSKDSKGIDGTLGGIGISVKPITFNGSSCKKYYKNPTIYYEMIDNEVTINYDELIVMLND